MFWQQVTHRPMTTVDGYVGQTLEGIKLRAEGLDETNTAPHTLLFKPLLQYLWEDYINMI